MVSLAAVTWNFPLVGRTRMLTEAWIAERQPTIFVQVPSLRTGLERLTAFMRTTDTAPVVRPWPIYPQLLWPALKERNLRRAIRRRARQLRTSLSRVLDWSQSVALVVSPVWTPWLDELPFRSVIYDCIDDVAVHIPRPELRDLYLSWERALIGRATGGVATAERLAQYLHAKRPDLPVEIIRNGVDVARFREAARSAPRPPDLPRERRPIVGFVGALYNWIDWRLIGDVVRALSEVDFVFVGPHEEPTGLTKIAQLPNARFLGARPYRDVPRYIEAFDVCWVPFTQDSVAFAANPVKIYEYLALGKPVVSTPVADTETFGDLVRVGSNAADITEALRQALQRSPDDSEARVAFANANTWAARARDYVEFARTM